MKDNKKTGILSLAVISILLGGCTAKNVEVQGSKGEALNTPGETVSLNHGDFIKETALHDAVRAKDLETVKYLLSQNTDIDTKDIYGYTPLHIAVRLNQLDIVNLLIEKGADLNNLDNYKDTPLLDSTRNDFTEMSKLLICSGAQREVKDMHDISPLHNSTKNNNLYLVKMLNADKLDPFCKVQEEVKAEETLPKEEIIPKVEKKEIEDVVDEEPSFAGLREALKEEFKDDFEKWNAELADDELLFRFKNPDTLFEVGKSELNERYTNILSDFFPRYLKILESYKNEIKEIRIQGHTSSEYRMAKTETQRYSFNKKLSQKRADAVRDYSIQAALKDPSLDEEWVKSTFKAYGISYDEPILNADGSENAEASRRVEFKIEKNKRESKR